MSEGEGNGLPVRYSDLEVTQILRRAVELQEKEGAGGGGAGLTLEQLQDIARDVGVDPRFVQDAARSLVRTRRNGRLLGGPTEFHFVQILPQGYDPARTQAMIDEIRTVMGRHGRVAEVADALEWQARDAGGGTFVSVSRVGHETRARVIGIRTEACVTVYMVFGCVALLGSIAAGRLLIGFGAAGSLLGAVLVTGSAWLGARALWTRIARRWDRRLRLLLRSVVEVLKPDSASDN